MFAFVLRRLIQALVVMLVVAFIAFMLFQYVGDPVFFLRGQEARPDQIRQLRTDLGLDQPFLVQFWRFCLNAAQGEFGLSLRQGAKVSRLLAERFPATLELSLVAAVLALVIGVPLGVYSALKHGSFLSHIFMTISLLGVSLPTFSAFISNAVLPLIVPPVTFSPSAFSAGIGSPVIILSSITAFPLKMIPSTGIFSPGFTFRRSPTSTSSNGISSSLPFLIIRATGGTSPSKALIAELVLL